MMFLSIVSIKFGSFGEATKTANLKLCILLYSSIEYESLVDLLIVRLALQERTPCISILLSVVTIILNFNATLPFRRQVLRDRLISSYNLWSCYTLLI